MFDYKKYNDWGRQFNRLKTDLELFAQGKVRFDLSAYTNAEGDMYYRGADGYLTVVPKDADGKVLTLVGGVPAWMNAGVDLSNYYTKTDLQTAGQAMVNWANITNGPQFSTGLTYLNNIVTNNLSTGIAGGQSVYGGTAAGENLTLQSTQHATKGKIWLGTSAVYDQAINWLGLGLTNPALRMANTMDVVASNSQSGPSMFVDIKQTRPNSTDTNDIALFLRYKLEATSTANQLVNRVFHLDATNALTGGGQLSNFRVMNIAGGTTAGSVTPTMDMIFIESGAASGSVTTYRGLFITSAQGTYRAGVVVNALGGTNRVGLLLGQYTSPVGAYSIYSGSTDAAYFAGNITANAFVKNGGTSAQFLKADGSVDSNVYLTSATSGLSNYYTKTESDGRYAPVSGSGSYIQNQFTSAQNADLWVSGYARVGSANSYIQQRTGDAAVGLNYTFYSDNSTGHQLYFGINPSYGSVYNNKSFIQSNREFVFVGASGNVLMGVGGTYTLDVAGSGRFSSTLTVNGATDIGNSLSFNNNVYDFAITANDGYDSTTIVSPRNVVFRVAASKTFGFQIAGTWLAYMNWNGYGLYVDGNGGFSGSMAIGNIPNLTTDPDKILVSDGGVIKHMTKAQLGIGTVAAGSGNYIQNQFAGAQSAYAWVTGYFRTQDSFQVYDATFGNTLVVGSRTIQSYGNHLQLNPLGNNVGIGTTNPSYTLDVAGSGRFSSFLTADELRIQGSTALSAVGAVLTTGAGFTTWKVNTTNMWLGTSTDNGYSTYPIHLGRKTIAYDDVFLSSGSLGIGTAPNTTYKLDVVGSGRFTGNLNIDTTGVGYTALVHKLSGSPITAWEADSNSGLRVYSYDATVLDYTFKVGFSGQLYVRDIPNTGTDPDKILVYSSDKVLRYMTKAQLGIGATISQPAGQVVYGSGTGVTSSSGFSYTTSGYASINSSHAGGSEIALTSGVSYRIMSTGNAGYSVGSGAFAIYDTTNAAWRMVIKSDGTVQFGSGFIYQTTGAYPELILDGTGSSAAVMRYKHSSGNWTTGVDSVGSFIIGIAGAGWNYITIDNNKGETRFVHKIVPYSYSDTDLVNAGFGNGSANNTTGAVHYNTTAARLKVYNGTAWKKLLTEDDLSSATISQPANQILYGTGTGVTSTANLQFDRGTLLLVGAVYDGVHNLIVNGEGKMSNLRVYNAGTGQTRVTFHNNSSSGFQIGYNYTGGLNDHSFYIYDNANTASRLLITSDGKLLVGYTTAPIASAGYLLQVNGAAYFSAGSTGSGFAITSSGSSVQIGTLANYGFDLLTNGTAKASLTNDGKFLIGYTASQGAYQLQVNGGSYVAATNAVDDIAQFRVYDGSTGGIRTDVGVWISPYGELRVGRPTRAGSSMLHVGNGAVTMDYYTGGGIALTAFDGAGSLLKIFPLKVLYTSNAVAQLILGDTSPTVANDMKMIIGYPASQGNYALQVNGAAWVNGATDIPARFYGNTDNALLFVGNGSGSVYIGKRLTDLVLEHTSSGGGYARLTQDGKFLIGYTASQGAYQLQVNGNVYLGGSNAIITQAGSVQYWMRGIGAGGDGPAGTFNLYQDGTNATPFTVYYPTTNVVIGRNVGTSTVPADANYAHIIMEGQLTASANGTTYGVYINPSFNNGSYTVTNYALGVVGAATISKNLWVGGDSNSDVIAIKSYAFGVTGVLGNYSDGSLMLRADYSSLRFGSGGANNRMVLMSDGKFLIGYGDTSQGDYQLQTNGVAYSTGLTVNGMVNVKYSSASANKTLGTGDYFVAVDASAAPKTITLPSAAGLGGRVYVIKKIDSTANAVAVTAATGETIDGAATYNLTTQWKTVTVVSNGSGWYITNLY